MRDCASRGKSRMIVGFCILREGEGAYVVTTTDNFRPIAETVSLVVIIHTDSCSLGLHMLNGTSNRNFTWTPRLAPAMTLTLDGLSAHTSTSLHLLSKEDLLLVEMRSSVMNIKILEMVMLHTGPLPWEELLLIQMSRLSFNFSWFRRWTFRFRKLLQLAALESFHAMGRLDFNIWWMCFRLLDWALLLN